MNDLFVQQMLVLFAILAIGVWVGQLSFKGLSLGPAGVLFTALVFGHFGFTIPRSVTDLGLLLFVYAVGLQAGPRFFRTFRRHGIQYVMVAAVVACAGAITTLAVYHWLKLPAELATGLFTGALTCTPALAAAVDTVSRSNPSNTGIVSAGYSIAYPFGMIGIVLLMQVLPKLLHRDLTNENARWQVEKQSESPGLEARQYRITNPNCDNKTVSEVNPHRMTMANISRVKRRENVFAASPGFILNLNDVVMVVGTPEELEKMLLVLGEETHERMDVNADVLSVDVEVTEESLTGKKLAQMRLWERYTVVITRIRRQGLEITPTGNITLEIGDSIRVVGDKSAVQDFVRLVHRHPQRAEETNLLPFFIGLLMGILIGNIPINLPNGLQLKLGSAGGAFLVSLLIGHFGGIGSMRLYVPTAARNILRDLGLMLFLAGAGVMAGAQFVAIFLQQGIQLLLSGALVTILSAFAGLVVMHILYRQNMLNIMGGLSACMTNPAGLNSTNTKVDSDLPTLAYASVYPVALIFKIILAQLLVGILLKF